MIAKENATKEEVVIWLQDHIVEFSWFDEYRDIIMVDSSALHDECQLELEFEYLDFESLHDLFAEVIEEYYSFVR